MVYTGFTQDDWSSAQQSFIEDFIAATQPLTIHRVWSGAAKFWVFPISPEHDTSGRIIRLREIEAIKPGQGDGRRAMSWILGLADRHEVEVRLMVDANNYTSRMPKDDDLYAWYQRLGFTRMRRPEQTVYANEMSRDPRLLTSFP